MIADIFESYTVDVICYLIPRTYSTLPGQCSEKHFPEPYDFILFVKIVGLIYCEKKRSLNYL